MQYNQLKSETDQRIDELESDMEKILQEKKEKDSESKRTIDQQLKQIQTLKTDWKHYEDLYQASENNCNTIWKEKLKTLAGMLLILFYKIY